MRTTFPILLVLLSAGAAVAGIAMDTAMPWRSEVDVAQTADPGGIALPAAEAASGMAQEAPASSFRWTCAPGPEWYTEMYDAGGYPKARRNDVGSGFHQFYFTRAMYNDFRRFGNYLGDGGPAWSIDYPMADRIMMAVATRLSNLDACPWENPVSLADPDLRRFPFVYTLEWGYADLTEQEVLGLRGFLEAGGLLMVDDFWGRREWANFEYQMRRVLPDRPIVDIPRDHLLFRSYYQIEGDILQVPNVGNGRRVALGIPGARTDEGDGSETPYIRGIFDDDGRLMVVIYANTDLGDALEWAEDPRYPLMYSRFASELFLNTIIYAMTQ